MTGRSPRWPLRRRSTDVTARSGAISSRPEPVQPTSLVDAGPSRVGQALGVDLPFFVGAGLRWLLKYSVCSYDQIEQLFHESAQERSSPQRAMMAMQTWTAAVRISKGLTVFPPRLP